MQIEHVTRIGFAARRAAQQQRHLAIGHGLLGKIVIHDHGVHAVVAEEFAHGAAGVGCQELQRGRFRSGGGDHDRIFHRAIFFQRAHDLRHGRTLLADGDIDAIQLLALVRAGVHALLVDEGIDGDSGLAGLTVTDDQFALAAANRHQRVERLQAGLHRFVDGFARDDARRLHFHAHAGHVHQRALAIDRVAQAINNAAQQALAHRHVDDGAGALDGVAFLDGAVRTEDHDTNVIGFQVQGHALDAAREFDHFTGLHIVQTMHAGDTVANAEHLADFRNLRFGAEIGDLILDDPRDFSGIDVHLGGPLLSFECLAEHVEPGLQ